MDMPMTRNALVASSVDSPPKAMTGSIVKTDRGRVDDWAAWPVSGLRAFTIADVATSSCCSGGIAERIQRITSSVNSGYCDADFAVLCPNCHRMLQGHAALTLNELRDRMASLEQTQ
jgi:hypothetical protein